MLVLLTMMKKPKGVVDDNKKPFNFYKVTPECRVAESRRVGKLLTSIILLIGSNNAAARLKTINNTFIF